MSATRPWRHSATTSISRHSRGKRVVVIGVGASAVDNAARGAGSGAGEVRLLARRKEMPTVNKLMASAPTGVTAGFAKIDPEWRWRIMDYSVKQQTPAPHNSTLRVSRHPNAFFHFDCAIGSMREEGGEVLITTTKGRVFRTDFVILGTGFTVRSAQPRRARALSGPDRLLGGPLHAAAGEENSDLGRFPWLDDDFSFTEKEPGTASWLKDIHCFNYGALISIGKVSGDIPANQRGRALAGTRIAASLFIRDIDYHWKALLAYEKPELDGSEWTDADAPQPAHQNCLNFSMTIAQAEGLR